MSMPVRSTKLPEEFIGGVIISCAQCAQNNDDNHRYISNVGSMSLKKMFFSTWEINVIKSALTSGDTDDDNYMGVIGTIVSAILNFRTSGKIIRGVSMEETNPEPKAPDTLDGVYEKVMASYKKGNNI